MKLRIHQSPHQPTTLIISMNNTKPLKIEMIEKIVIEAELQAIGRNPDIKEKIANQEEITI